jgi:hypothetical protein
MLTYRSRFWKLFILILVLLPIIQSWSHSHAPGSFIMVVDHMDVIVTAVTTETATQAVLDVGGEITSELWLIKGVGAVLTPDQLAALTEMPGITSITPNKSIWTTDNGNGNQQGHYGWVSNRRRTSNNYGLTSRPKVPAVSLPDGGAFVVTEQGDSVIFNADGSQRAQLRLTKGPFLTSPVVTQNGIIVVASNDKYAYAISANGSLLWTFISTKNLKVQPVVDENNSAYPDGIVYITNEDGIIDALNLVTGESYWTISSRSLIAADPGKVKGTPVVGPNNTLYVVTERGYLFSFNPQATVQLNWIFQAQGSQFTYSLMVDSNGLIYMPFKDGMVVSTPEGQLNYRFVTEKSLTAQPVILDDGLILVPAEKFLYGIEADGTLRFQFLSPAGGKFEATPAVSPDHAQIYAPLRNKFLYAINSVSGELIWSHRTSGELRASPTVASNGDIHLGAVDGYYTILDPNGSILFRSNRRGDLRLAPTLSTDQKSVFLTSESKFFEAVSLMPDTWNGIPDVQATGNSRVWQVLTPVSIDVGADVLHDPELTNGAPFTGKGVTIAIIDSGVYFDRNVKDILGSDVEKLFWGQADFTNNGLCIETNKEIIQRNGYCWSTHKASRDPYGHGSHVAGVIWNQFTDANTGVNLGIAPGARVLSVRALDENGQGTYEDVIKGIQYVVTNKNSFNIRVLNLSLSSMATTPYFADPLNQAVEAAWASGIAVVAAAGNGGPAAQSITVPGNDPYIITVGAVNSRRTPGYWLDDTLPIWSATGPTLDGFIKPDILAPGSNVVSFMYNDPYDMSKSAYLVQQHPDYSATISLFRMNGTSVATAVTSGVIALILEAHPHLSPDQVKYRLMATTRTAVSENDEPAYSILQQGVGRIWAPDAVLANLPNESANGGLNLQNELNYLWQPGDNPDPSQNPDLAFHYQGPVQRLTSDDGSVYMYFIPDNNNQPIVLGMAQTDTLLWLDQETVATLGATFLNGQLSWDNGYVWSGGTYAWSGGTYAWSGGTYAWSGGTYAWSGGTYAWSGGTYAWSGGTYAWSGGTYAWSGNSDWADEFGSGTAHLSSTPWVEE